MPDLKLKPHQQRLYADIIEFVSFRDRPLCYYHDLLKYELRTTRSINKSVDRVMDIIRFRNNYIHKQMPDIIKAEIATFRLRLIELYPDFE